MIQLINNLIIRLIFSAKDSSFEIQYCLLISSLRFNDPGKLNIEH